MHAQHGWLLKSLVSMHVQLSPHAVRFLRRFARTSVRFVSARSSPRASLITNVAPRAAAAAAAACVQRQAERGTIMLLTTEPDAEKRAGE